MFFIPLDERIGLFKGQPIFRLVSRLEHLLREVVVDEGGFEGEVVRGIDGIAFVLRRLLGRFADREKIEMGIVAFVEE